MKKLTVVLVTLLLMVLLSAGFMADASYGVFEAEFDIPYEFSAIYGEGELSENEFFRFVAPDNSVELSCRSCENIEEISFAFMDIRSSVDYYLEKLSDINSEDYIFNSVQTYHADGFSDGIMFEGTIEKSDESIPVYVYAFSTTGKLYGFEFTVYNSSGIEYIDEIVDSLYFNDFEMNSEDEEVDNSGGMSEFFLLLMFSTISIISAVLKSKKKKSAKGNKSGPIFDKVQKMSEKPDNEKININKFELNGKNINIFNERFTVGKADDNFAQKELERERKEREKMFSKGE